MFRAIVYETSSTKECLIRMESLLPGEGRGVYTVGGEGRKGKGTRGRGEGTRGRGRGPKEGEGIRGRGRGSEEGERGKGMTDTL